MLKDKQIINKRHTILKLKDGIELIKLESSVSEQPHLYDTFEVLMERM